MRSSGYKLVEHLRAGKISRRHALSLLGSVGVAAITAKVSPSALAGSQPVMMTWATMDVPELFPKYVEKHGAPPQFAIFGDEDEAFLKVKNGFKPDVVYPMSYITGRYLEADMLEAIDTSRIAAWNDIFAPLRAVDGVTVNGQTMWVPCDWGLSSVLVRTDLAPEYADKDTWDILWDPKYSGRLAMLDSMADAVGAAAIKAGVDAYAMSDAERNKVRKALTEQRPLLRMYSNDPTSIQQALTSGEIVAANTWNDCYTALRSAKLPVKYMKPTEGVMTWVGGLSIIKGTKNLDLAHDVIDAYLDPRSRIAEMEKYGYVSATAAGFDGVDDATRERLDLPKDPTAFLSRTIIQRLMKDQSKVQKMFEEVKQGV